MANRVPYYFLAPTWDLPPPPLGPMRLGSIITSVKAPERPLFSPPTPPGVEDVFEQRRFLFSTEKLRAGRFEIFTRFLSAVVGVGVDAVVSWESANCSQFAFDSLETIQLNPTPAYLQKCIKTEPVRRFLDKSRHRKPVYNITGIKIARGAKVGPLNTQTVGAEAAVKVDGTIWGGVPISGGPGVGGQTGKRQDVVWEGGSDFVFAFRVRKVVVAERTGAVAFGEDYTRGAVMRSSLAVAGQWLAMDVIVSEGEADLDEDAFVSETLMEGDGQVFCAVPIGLHDGGE